MTTMEGSTMDTTAITERVKLILTAKIGMASDAIASDARFVDDLELDSLDSVELVIATEKEFDIAIHEERFEELKTVQDVVRLVQELLAARNAVA